MTTALRCITGRPTLESNYCWTFSDPNTAGSCIQSAAEPFPTAVTSFWNAFRAKCTSLGELESNDEIAPYLGDVLADSLRVCIEGANNCSAASDCIRNNVTVAPFFACGGIDLPRN